MLFLFLWLLLGILVYMHRKFGSKLLIDLLSKLGLSHSYNDAITYENSSLTVDVPEDGDAFHQFVFDNADYNVNTLDGLNTFPQMGGIQCLTASAAPSFPSFPKLKNYVANPRMKPKNRVERWQTLDVHVTGCNIADINDLRQGYCDGGRTMPTNATLLWMYASAKENDVPSWSGFMSNLTKLRTYEVSKIRCLPFIKLPPSSPDAQS